MKELRAILERDDLTMEELVGTANELLARVAPQQTRYKVTDRPDARTIRYYVNQGLLPRPVSYSGGRARYSGRHVVRLLAIKKLQADHLTLAKIKSVLGTIGDEEVLGLTETPRDVPIAEPIEPAAPAAAEPLVRFHLPGGGSVDVPQQALADRAGRDRIATQLRAIARLVETDDTGDQP